MRNKKKKQRNHWKTAMISLFIFVAITYLWSGLMSSNSISPTNNYQEQNNNYQEQNKYSVLENILQEYHKTHTYSMIDLFVCTDTSIDVWNLVKTEGINARICAGNINENLSGIEFFNEMNHAWVIAETEPFTWLALETTGGYLVYGDENHLYYEGRCFDTPSKFKKFIALRDDYFDTCGEAELLIEEWNNNYVGKILNSNDYEFKGKMEVKKTECEEIMNKLIGLLS